MTHINLTYLNLKTFTEQNISDYCQINNINHEDITSLYLNNNDLTDISEIKLFKNLKHLYIDNNKITDISVIRYLKNIEILNITYLQLESDQIQYIKNLKILFCFIGFKDINTVNQFNNINIIK